MTATVDPRRSDKINRYKPVDSASQGAGVGDDLMPDYMNILGKEGLQCTFFLIIRVSQTSSFIRKHSNGN